MSDQLDIDKLSDDDLDAIMDQAEAEAGDPEVVMQEAHEEVTHDEDTDHTDESDTEDVSDDTETNDPNDEDGGDTGEADDGGDDEADEENTLVDEDGSKDDEGEEADKSDEDSTDTTDEKDEQSDGDADTTDKDTDTIDYKTQYEELMAKSEANQKFYDEVTAEFTANGKKMKGFTDPKKIIQSQQMAAGFSEKMSGFKPYRPFMSTIKDQGWLEDPSKFDMAVNLMNKDPEAIKQLIKDSGVDVLDMDMDNINYAGKQHTASNAEVALDDVMASARASGVESNIREVLGGQWSNDGSLVEVLNNPNDAQALVNHMVEDADGNSAYKDIQARMSEKLRTDYNGSYSGKNSLQQYREAAGELEHEYNESVKQARLDGVRESQKAQADKVAAEKAKIETQRQEREYKTKVETETKKVNEARKKAADMSKPKAKTKAKANKFDPMALNDSELDDFLLTLK